VSRPLIHLLQYAVLYRQPCIFDSVVFISSWQADLIAVGRQSQFNPNIAHHWAHDLGINRKFEDWAPEYGWWLEKRIRTMEGFATPLGVVKRPTPGVNSRAR